MNNKSKYDDVNINLWDYAHGYLEMNPEYENSNKITYGLCCEYIYGNISPNNRERLVLMLSA